MNKIDNKGFTLIELIASIFLLAVIMSVTTVSIVNVVQNSDEKSYSLLVSNIKIGAQEYFEECENKNLTNTTIDCPNIIKGTGTEYFDITLKKLLSYGFLKSNATDDIGEKIIKNPKTNGNMNSCQLRVIKYVSEDYSTWYEFNSLSTDSNCPTTDEYNN